MARHVGLHRLALVVCSVALAGYPALARAQSAVDGFDPGANGVVYAVAVQADGKILVGGLFTTLGGAPRNNIGRLNADGSIDTSFNPGASNSVVALAVQPDGKILAGGWFTTLGGAPCTYIGRLNTDGSLDASFNPGANNAVFAVAVQTDGRILLGGNLTTLGGVPRNWIGRLNADGSLDTSFNPRAGGVVDTLAVQADGKIVVGGSFTMLGGGGAGTAPRLNIGRLTNTNAAIQGLAVSRASGTIAWLRSGAGPEVGRVTFESSPDGAGYTALGSGTRIAGGWQLTGQSLPISQNLFIRARGYYATGVRNGSGSIVESVRNVYLAQQPFTDGELIAAVSVIKAVHITELRTRIDALRARYVLGAYGYTNSSILAGTSGVNAVDITEMRTALSQAYTTAGLAPPSYSTSPSIGAAILVADIADLRSAVVAIE